MVDEHGGKEDLTRKIIAAVGNADERFREDALRTLRAVRLSAELDFVIDGKTATAIAKDASQLEKIRKNVFVMSWCESWRVTGLCKRFMWLKSSYFEVCDTRTGRSYRGGAKSGALI